MRSFDETGSREVFGVAALQIDQQLRTILEQTELSDAILLTDYQSQALFFCFHLFSIFCISVSAGWFDQNKRNKTLSGKKPTWEEQALGDVTNGPHI